MTIQNMTFGQRLKYFRRDRKLTQIKLAELSHASPFTISTYEKDRAEPKFAIAVAFADALEVDIEYLIPEYWRIKKEE